MGRFLAAAITFGTGMEIRRGAPGLPGAGTSVVARFFAMEGLI